MASLCLRRHLKNADLTFFSLDRHTQPRLAARARPAPGARAAGMAGAGGAGAGSKPPRVMTWTTLHLCAFTFLLHMKPSGGWASCSHVDALLLSPPLPLLRVTRATPDAHALANILPHWASRRAPIGSCVAHCRIATPLAPIQREHPMALATHPPHVPHSPVAYALPRPTTSQSRI